ncbi:disulfide isomerase DsbC N-terminal domain-containing protein [Vibrio fluvialis]|uniref:disulfide isomerase DsbC N-terminal domain-containing protein n=1 Tax=Vibrio fluvialis TaxID=676 RepID=UPI001302D351|nr:disulfide isomerase DsbC N-terminal domain-containing protein [Vibrio fluvialis]
MAIQFKHIAVLQFLTILLFGAGLYMVNQRVDSALTSHATAPGMEEIRKTIQASMPNTPIRSVMPAPIQGLYEVTSSNGLLYTDEKGRFLFVGGIYDPKTNTDIVLERKKELGFSKTSDNDSQKTSPSSVSTAQNPSRGPGPFPMSVETLNKVKDYAITYREIEGAPVIYELFDPMCGYCRKNQQELEKLPVTIKKLLVVSVGSADINKQVYCSIDPVSAIKSLTSTNSLVSDGRSRADCDVTDLDKIKDWMNDNGIPGSTPQSIILDKEQLWRGAADSSVWKQRLGL